MTELELFTAALERPPDGRSVFLDRACGADAGLRARVGELLHYHDPAEVALHRPPLTALQGAGFDGNGAEDPLVGKAVAGRYCIERVIGRGGMGTVYLARQTEPVQREVALKVVTAGRATPAALARFEAERQALA